MLWDIIPNIWHRFSHRPPERLPTYAKFDHPVSARVSGTERLIWVVSSPSGCQHRDDRPSLGRPRTFSPQRGGKNGRGNSREVGRYICLIRCLSATPTTSGCATRAYFEISQNRFWQSMGCKGRPKRPAKSNPRQANSSPCRSATHRITHSGDRSTDLKHFDMPSSAPGPAMTKSVSAKSKSVE